MILLVLIQRGRGGGLVGAFGGMGGQSAFGTKAGDLFTRITMYSAAVWIILCAFATKCLNDNVSKLAVPGQAPPAGRGERIGAPPPAEPPADAKATDAKLPDAKLPDAKLPDPQPADAKPADAPSGNSKATTPAPGEAKPAAPDSKAPEKKSQ
jgi:preprotein translocase subunit SecG